MVGFEPPKQTAQNFTGGSRSNDGTISPLHGSGFAVCDTAIVVTTLSAPSSKMNKKALTETDIRTKFIITPALVGADGSKWNLMTQIREESYFTKGPRHRSGQNGQAR